MKKLKLRGGDVFSNIMFFIILIITSIFTILIIWILIKLLNKGLDGLNIMIDNINYFISTSISVSINSFNFVITLINVIGIMLTPIVSIINFFRTII